MFTVSLYLEAQIYYSTGPTVYTCRGGQIATIIPNRELNTNEKASALASLINPNGQFYYLGITASDIISEASSTYNCHAYAWHLREGNTNKVWINNTYGYSDFEGCLATTNNLDTYWSNTLGCFIEVLESQAEKIHYYCGDHSAVKSYVEGKYDSKWGQFPVVRHSPNQVPYSHPDRRKYYAKPYISGISLICNQSTYSINNLPTGATVTWSSSPNNLISHSTSGHPITVTKTGNGQVTLTALINQGITISKNIWLGSPSTPTIIGPQHVEVGGMGSYSASVLGDFNTTYQWSVSPSSYTIYSSGANATIYFNAQSDYTITVSATNACGTTTTYYYVATGELEPFSIYPNPATDLLTVSYNSETENKGVVENNENKFTIQLWNETNGLVKSIESNSSTKQISLRGLPKGMYSVHIVKENKTVRKQLILIK